MCFSVGSVVLKKRFLPKEVKGREIRLSMGSPFVITDNLGKGLFKLKELNGVKLSLLL